MFRGSDYISEAFDSITRQRIVESFKKCLDDGIYGDIDTLACRGTSGLVVASTLAHIFNLKLMVVRKGDEQSHSSRILEGHDDTQRYIIVDDFSASGITLEKILEGVSSARKEWGCILYSPIYVGCYFWTHHKNPFNKENIYGTDKARFNKVARGKVFAARFGSEYKLDRMNEEEYFS